MKDGPGRDGRLMVAGGAFIPWGGPVGPLNRPVRGPLAFGAHETIRPSLFEEVIMAGFVRCKPISVLFRFMCLIRRVTLADDREVAIPLAWSPTCKHTQLSGVRRGNGLD